MQSSQKPTQAIEVFYSYAHEDEKLRKKLEQQLRILERLGLITEWHDRKISPGEEWKEQIDAHLNTADIILLLVSPAFMASDYCYDEEMKRAMDRHDAEDARVIPIILRPTIWKDAPWGKLQALPRDGKPVKSRHWHSSDEAFFDAAKGIQRAIKEWVAKHASSEDKNEPIPPNSPPPAGSIEQWLEECNAHYRAKRYRKALASYNRIVQFEPKCAFAWISIGDLQLYHFKKYTKALAAYDQAIRLDPINAYAYSGKSLALRRLGEYKNALAACEKAIELIPSSAIFYTAKGHILHELEQYMEMLAAYERAIELDPNYAAAENGKGNALYYLRRYPEALAAYERAIVIDPYFDLPYSNKGYTLKKLGRPKEAEQAFKDAQNPHPAKDI